MENPQHVKSKATIGYLQYTKALFSTLWEEGGEGSGGGESGEERREGVGRGERREGRGLGDGRQERGERREGTRGSAQHFRWKRERGEADERGEKAEGRGGGERGATPLL